MQILSDLPVDLIFKWFGYFSAIGLFFAGVWKGIKTRAYAVRLESVVTGEILTDGSATYIKISITMKNIGTAHALIKDSGYVDVSSMAQENIPRQEIKPSHIGTFRLFPGARSLESGESIVDTLLIAVSHGQYLAFHIEAGVTTTSKFGASKDRDWTKPVIINCRLKPIP